MLLWQHTAAGEDPPLQPIGTTAAAAVTSQGRQVHLHTNPLSNQRCHTQTAPESFSIFPLCPLFAASTNFSLSAASGIAAPCTVHSYLLLLTYTVSVTPSPCLWTYHPCFAPSCLLPLKRDGTRCAVVTQWDFFFFLLLLLLNGEQHTFTRTQAKMHSRQTSRDPPAR